MAVPFPDIDPYETLGVDNKDAPPLIKKAYYKLCLKYHPDKLSSEDQIKHKVKFEKIQFSYSILSDVHKRKRYDTTGSVEEVLVDGDDDAVNWTELFREMMDNDREITKESIEMDKRDYQDSNEEEEDIIECYEYYNGDFLKLFECIPHIEIDSSDEQRLFGKVQELITSKVLKSTKKFEKYSKNRDREFKKLLKSSKDEAEEAEVMLNEIYEKNNMKRLKNQSSEDSLMALIQNKNRNNKSNFDLLLEKYDTSSKQKPKSKLQSKKRANEYELDDDEFDKIQAQMLNKKKQKRKN